MAGRPEHMIPRDNDSFENIITWRIMEYHVEQLASAMLAGCVSKFSFICQALQRREKAY